jgi:sulfur dioxygenase
MTRLLSVTPNPAQIVVMRHHRADVVVSTLREELDAYREKAGEAERIRDSFRSDNVRLTHRISYLEEQVAELLARVSKNDYPPATVKAPVENISNGDSAEPQIQIFQKGPKVTLIGNVSPNTNSLKIRDTLPTVSNKLRNRVTCKSMDGLESPRLSESVSSLSAADKRAEMVTARPETRNRSICYMNYQSPSSMKNKENYCSINERRLRYIKEAQNSLINQRHFKDDRSCKSVDFDSEPNYQSLKHLANGRLTMYDSETSSDYSRAVKYPRPIPPQKPLRLSLHKGCSLQSVKIIDKSNGDAELRKNHAPYESIDKKIEKWC